MVIESQFNEMKSVTEMGPWGCLPRSVCVCVILLNCTLKNGRDGEFYVLYILPQFKKEEEKSHSVICSVEQVIYRKCVDLT